MLSVQSGGSSCHGRGIRGRFYLINQTPGGSLVRARSARVGTLLLITNEFSTEGLRAYSPSFSSSLKFQCSFKILI